MTHWPMRAVAIQTSQTAVIRLQRVTHGASTYGAHLGSCRGPHPWTTMKVEANTVQRRTQAAERQQQHDTRWVVE